MIGEARTAIMDVLNADRPALGVMVFRVLPEDIADLPCIVVGRPSLVPSEYDVPTLTMRVPVYVVGSRIGGDDAQDELDNLSSDVFVALGRNQYELDLGPMLMGGRMESLTPTVVSVAGQDYPAYIVTILAELARC